MVKSKSYSPLRYAPWCFRNQAVAAAAEVRGHRGVAQAPLVQEQDLAPQPKGPMADVLVVDVSTLALSSGVAQTSSARSCALVSKAGRTRVPGACAKDGGFFIGSFSSSSESPFSMRQPPGRFATRSLLFFSSSSETRGLNKSLHLDVHSCVAKKFKIPDSPWSKQPPRSSTE